ncbi:MAG: RidA family protein [Alphaproteobacteria bacterium]|nr:RidA family protein [Alphaproteobacteria bacterium]
MKKIISAPSRPKAHYNNAVAAEGKFLFIATQPSTDWETGTFLDGDIYFQTQKALENIVYFLSRENITLDNVVKMGIFLADINDFDAMNEVYNRFFPDPETAPVRFTLQTPFPNKKIKVEFEAIAVLP